MAQIFFLALLVSLKNLNFRYGIVSHHLTATMLLEKVLSTTQYVTQYSRQVKINQMAIERLAKKIKAQPLPAWDTTIHSAGNPQETVQYIFYLIL